MPQKPNSEINKMKQTLKGLVAAGAIGLTSFMPMNAEAQLPFFTGRRTPTSYALENRTIVGTEDPEFNNILIAKTFRKEVPLWAYVGKAYNNEDGFGDFFYGAGPMITIKDRLSILATVEGSGDEFSGASLYSTLLLPENFHVDFHPRLDSDLNYDFTSFNIGKTHKGITFGISSDFKDGKFRSLEETDLRVARVRRGTFIDVGFNLGRKRVMVAIQRTF